MCLSRSRTCRWRDRTTPESTADGLLLFATEAQGGEDDGGSVPHPLRAIAHSRLPPTLIQVRWHMTLIF